LGKPEGSLRRSLTREEEGGGFEPAATECIRIRWWGGWEECESLGIESTEGGGRVEGEGAELPTSLLKEWMEEGLAAPEVGGGFIVFVEVDEGGTERLKTDRSLGDVLVRRKEVCEELGGEATFENFIESARGICVERDRERGVLPDFVLHGTDGFVDGVDDEVAGRSADNLAEMAGVLVDGKGDGSGYVGGGGESRAIGIETERED
jgi:hypothetical protein